MKLLEWLFGPRNNKVEKSSSFDISLSNPYASFAITNPAASGPNALYANALQNVMDKDGRKAVMTDWFFQPVRGQPRKVDLTELRKFAQEFWINTCISTIVDEISALEWDIVPKEDYQDHTSNPRVLLEKEEIKNFFNKVNRNGDTIEDIIRAYIKDSLELDAGVIIKTYSRDSYGEPDPIVHSPQLKDRKQRFLTELYAADGGSFLKEITRNGVVQGYWQYSFAYPSMPIWFWPEEVIYDVQHIRSFSPYGYSPVQAVLEIVKTLHYSVIHNKSMFEMNAMPNGIVAIEGVNQAELDRMRVQWQNSFQGKPNQIAFTAKKADFIPFTINNQQLQFLESQQWYMKLVVSAFKLTPSELGFVEDVNKSNGVTQTEVVKRRAIRPLIRRIEKIVNDQILPELGIVYSEFRYVVKDMEEEMQKVQIAKTHLESGIKTINEVRRELGLDPVAWGDGPNSSIYGPMGSPFTPSPDGETEQSAEDDGSPKDESVQAPPHPEEKIADNHDAKKTDKKKTKKPAKKKSGGELVSRCINCETVRKDASLFCTKCTGKVFEDVLI